MPRGAWLCRAGNVRRSLLASRPTAASCALAWSAVVRTCWKVASCPMKAMLFSAGGSTFLQSQHEEEQLLTPPPAMS